MTTDRRAELNFPGSTARDERDSRPPQPDKLSGCTCGGIGDTAAHFRGCARAIRR